MHRIASVTSFVLLCALAAPAAAAPRAFSVEVSGHGAPVLLIPGLSCGGDVWRATVEHYRRGHELHVITLAGFAGTPALPPGTPLMATVRDQLADYIRAHKLVKPVVVGHSLGGFLALWLAAREPEIVGGVVVVDALPYLPAVGDARLTVAEVEPRAEQLRAMLSAATPEAFARQNRAALATMITDPKQADAVAVTSRRSDPKTVAEAMYELMTTDLRPSLAKVRAPTLVLAAAGGGDAATVRAAYEAQYAGLAGHTLAVATKARHFIMLDDPGFFFGQLDAFFARLRKGA